MRAGKKRNQLLGIIIVFISSQSIRRDGEGKSDSNRGERSWINWHRIRKTYGTTAITLFARLLKYCCYCSTTNQCLCVENNEQCRSTREFHRVCACALHVKVDDESDAIRLSIWRQVALEWASSSLISRNCLQPSHATCLAGAGRRDHRPHADTSHARVPYCLQYSASNSIYIWCVRIVWANGRSTLNGMERNESDKQAASAYCDETNEWMMKMWNDQMIRSDFVAF